MSSKSDLDEFEHEVDVLNVIFGAALGAYLGIIISQDGIDHSELWKLILLLGLLSYFLLNVRAVGRAIHGEAYIGLKFPWNISFTLATAAAIQMMALQIPIAGEKFSIIFRGWVIMLALLLGSGVIRSRWKRD